MKRLILVIVLLVQIIFSLNAQVQVNDSTFLFLDSLYMNLPEVMITGERPLVKSEQGKLVYDLPRIVSNLPVDNAYDAIKELPGIADMNGTLTLAGSGFHIVINGKLSSMSVEQLTELLKTIPVSRIAKAEVMHAAPARYQVRGPMINLILTKGDGTTPVTGELFTSWNQRHYASFTERASLLYTSPKFSADLLYSFNYGRRLTETEKLAMHTVNDAVYPMDLYDSNRFKNRTHNIRLGMDYSFSDNNTLNLIYTTQIKEYDNKGEMLGTQNSTTNHKGDNQMHNLRADYHASFGLNAGAEFTFYKAPGTQLVNSVLNDEEINARYKEKQRINKWMFYVTQEHELPDDWGIDYGLNYTIATDNSFQNYYDAETGKYEPERSMSARRQEYTVNGFAGVNKTFNEQLSADASFATELYHVDGWKEWMFYPTVNVTYIPSAASIFQLSFSSDKRYPEFWAMNNSVSYMSAYSEIHGNPGLKPAPDYNFSLTYVMKSKYVFTAYYSYMPDYFVQTLYQAPDRLAEIYKYMNFDFRRQFGVQVTAPFKIKNWLNSRIMAMGYHVREKNSHFWNTSFDRSSTSFIVTMNNTFNISAKPDIRLTVSGFYQNGSIQGIYDLDRSWYIDAALRWTSNNQKAQITLKGSDLFNTSDINPSIRFEKQNVTNRFMQDSRSVELSFSYKFGSYKEKKREEVDTSRFK